ncbi:MAG: hypothetical protein IJT31_04160 [Oscillibacter sp.]|nr:hypothetical protein [Oscillibacter sp.]
MVNVFIVNSSSDGADADRVKDYLEQADSAGVKHANVLILKNHVSSWHREFRRLMQETQLILFLQGEHSAESANIQWEMELAFELGKAVLVHQLRDNLPLPDWMKEQDAFTGEFVDKATICSLEDVKKRIERYDRKEYDIFSKSYLNLSPTDAEKEKERLFEQYKLYQATSEAVVERRQTVSNLYIIINGAFLTVIGTVIAADSQSLDMFTKLVVSAIMSIAGIILNSAWKQIIKSYGLLNQRKIEALNLIEENLPLRLYAVEWEIMDDKMNLKKYKSFTSTEVRTPELFIVLYAVIVLFFLGYRIKLKCMLCLIPLVLILAVVAHKRKLARKIQKGWKKIYENIIL